MQLAEKLATKSCVRPSGTRCTLSLYKSLMEALKHPSRDVNAGGGIQEGGGIALVAFSSPCSEVGMLSRTILLRSANIPQSIEDMRLVREGKTFRRIPRCAM